MVRITGVSIVYAIWMLGFIATAQSQELPNVKSLTAVVTDTLPGYWRVKNLRILRSSQAGDALTPLALIRYEADIEPAKQLFVTTGDTVGVFPVVVSSFAPGQARTLYGTMKLSYRAGVWSGPVEIENPVKGLGQPEDLYETPVVILGTERQSKIQELLASNQIQSFKNALNTELVTLQSNNEQALEVLRQENDQKAQSMNAELAVLERKNAEVVQSMDIQLAETKQENAAELIEVQRDQEKAKTFLAKLLKEEIEKLRSDSSPELLSLQKLQDEKIASLKKTQAEKLDEIQAEHAKVRGALTAQLRQKVSELEVGFEARIKSLKKQLSESTKLTELQNALAKTLKDQAKKYNFNSQLGKSLNTAKKQNLSGYLGIWAGTVSCLRRGLNYRVVFEATSVRGNNLEGIYTYKGSAQGKTSGSLAFRSFPVKYPANFAFISGDQKVFSYRGTLNADRTFYGKTTSKLAGYRDCEMVMSQSG